MIVRNDTKSRRIGTLVKKEIPGNADSVGSRANLRKGSDSNYMSIWATKGKTRVTENCFCNNMTMGWCLGCSSKMIFFLGYFNGHVGKSIESFMCVHGGNGIGKRNVEGRLLKICDEKEMGVANTSLQKDEKNITHHVDGCKKN